MAENKFLDKINSPADVKKLSVPQLEQLAKEIRQLLISVISHTGGHLAPNLGVVELTLALHKVFNTPEDKIIFDVGHQAYIHKIITGRREQFPTLRQYGGLSGFPKRSEASMMPSVPVIPVHLFPLLWAWPAPATCRVRIIMS